MENAKIVEQNILETKPEQNYVYQIEYQIVSSIDIRNYSSHVENSQKNQNIERLNNQKQVCFQHNKTFSLKQQNLMNVSLKSLICKIQFKNLKMLIS